MKRKPSGKHQVADEADQDQRDLPPAQQGCQVEAAYGNPPGTRGRCRRRCRKGQRVGENRLPQPG